MTNLSVPIAAHTVGPNTIELQMCDHLHPLSVRGFVYTFTVDKSMTIHVVSSMSFSVLSLYSPPPTPTSVTSPST